VIATTTTTTTWFSWHDHNRSGTLTFKVKKAGLSRYYRSADPYKSHNAKRGWFILVFDVIMLQAYRQIDTL
jgi:hypothetical protein